MSASTTTPPVSRKSTAPTITNIEKAIHVLVTLYVEGSMSHERQDELSARGILSVSDILMGAEAERQALCEDPRRWCYRRGIHELGQHLYDEYARQGTIAPLAGMLDSLYRISEMDPANEGYRGSAMDHIWDGVGDGQFNWMV